MERRTAGVQTDDDVVAGVADLELEHAAGWVKLEQDYAVYGIVEH